MERLCSAYLPKHIVVWRKPASEQTFRPGMYQRLPFCVVSHGLYVRWYCLSGPSTNAVTENPYKSRFFNAVLYLFSCLIQPHGSQLFHNTSSFFHRLLDLLSVDCLEHPCDLSHMLPWCNGENVLVEVHRTTLVFRIRKDLCHDVAHAEALVCENELYTVKSPFFQPYKEIFPAFSVFFHTLCSADAPIPELPDRERMCIMERKGDKTNVNKGTKTHSTATI